MKANQLIKWRERVLKGKDKYYPKNLVKNLLSWNVLNKEYPQNKKFIKSN